jgi:hypothetical protein
MNYLKKKSHHNSYKENKYFDINLIREVKDLYNSYKTLLKEIKDTKHGKITPCSFKD